MTRLRFEHSPSLAPSTAPAGIPAHRSMPAFQPTQETALEARGWVATSCLSTFACHRSWAGIGCWRFGLLHVNVLIHFLVAAMVARTSSGPNRARFLRALGFARMAPGGTDAPLSAIDPPEGDVASSISAVGVDSGEPGIRFTGRHRTILRGTVDFVLPVLEVSSSSSRSRMLVPVGG